MRLFPELDLGRRRFLKAAGLTGAGVAGLMFVGGQLVTASGAAVTDADILNFALNLEYLEAEFYSYATTGQGISASLFTGAGAQGATTGGAAVTFDTTTKTKSVANEIAQDELDHVTFLRNALGSAAVAKPVINLAALTAMGGQASFLEVARAFEDTGVTAYAGAAPLLQSKTYLQAAAQIFATEALHSGNVRKLCVEQGTPQVTLDSEDVPPSASQYFSVSDTSGLVATRTTAQVLAIVYGGPAPGAFFPAGMNGTIK
ncbi:MAG: ferritin-like domain-containing protein [Terriglobales bacterium]